MIGVLFSVCLNILDVLLANEPAPGSENILLASNEHHPSPYHAKQKQDLSQQFETLKNKLRVQSQSIN
jgi:hypothetical protein